MSKIENREPGTEKFVVHNSCFILALLLISAAHAAMQFSVDYATFRSATPDSETVEIYHSIPYGQLHYQGFGDTLRAVYMVKVTVEQIQNPESKIQNAGPGAPIAESALTTPVLRPVLTESVMERAMIPPRSSPAARKLSIGNSFSINLTPGRYLMQFEIRDTADQGSVTETLTVRDLRHVPSISDPIIGSSVVRLPSGLVSVVPMANRTFGPSGLHEMYVYVAGYDFARKRGLGAEAESSRGLPTEPSPETLAYELNIAILDSTGRVVKTLPTEQRKRTTRDISDIFGLSSQGLTPGDYQLRVSLRDLVNDSAASAGKWFYVTGSTPSALKLDTLSMTADERRAYTDIRYLATAREMGEYNSLSRAGKFEWLATKFWPQHDFETYYQRLQVADERFKFGTRLGRNTDEGRIYLRYGEPDDIEHHAMVEQTLSHEHWHYYRLGYHFIFVDVNSDGRLKLVYSNTDAEPKAQNWEKLIDPMELPDLEEK